MKYWDFSGWFWTLQWNPLQFMTICLWDTHYFHVHVHVCVVNTSWPVERERERWDRGSPCHHRGRREVALICHTGPTDTSPLPPQQHLASSQSACHVYCKYTRQYIHVHCMCLFIRREEYNSCCAKIGWHEPCKAEHYFPYIITVNYCAIYLSKFPGCLFHQLLLTPHMTARTYTPAYIYHTGRVCTRTLYVIHLLSSAPTTMAVR